MLFDLQLEETVREAQHKPGNAHERAVDELATHLDDYVREVEEHRLIGIHDANWSQAEVTIFCQRVSWFHLSHC